MQAQQPLVVAIDGPSGSGKSTVSRRIAETLLGRYVDTGAMYRALTWWLLEHRVDPTDAAAVAAACARPQLQVGTNPQAPQIHVDGHDVAGPIRSDRVTAAVSYVAAVPEVREHLVAIQRAVLAEAQAAGVSIVLEGRDIGSVVAPNADLKIWLTADPTVRAHRRALEVAAVEVAAAATPPASATVDGLNRRDHLDAHRATSPAAPASDAVQIDATYLTVDEVVVAVLEQLAQRTGGALPHHHG